ncbi:MAG: FAD-dependent oxidoreductase [Clostridiales bacterium]|nr:FAD-dependent oxidoreductase [Clostridiales bacterium]
MPDIPGGSAGGVYTLRTMQDARAIKEKAERGKQAVVLGAGPVSVKTAYALLKNDMEVSAVVGSPCILSRVMDKYGAELIQNHLEKHGMKFYLEKQVQEITQDSQGNVSGIKLDDNTVLPCSMIIIGKGVQPNAAAQGKMAGHNMAGYQEPYPGSISLNALEFFGLDAVTAGVSNPQSSEYEILENKDKYSGKYRRLVFSGDTLAGYAAVNDIDGIGALTARILNNTPVKDKYALLHGRPPILGSTAYHVG